MSTTSTVISAARTYTAPLIMQPRRGSNLTGPNSPSSDHAPGSSFSKVIPFLDRQTHKLKVMTHQLRSSDREPIARGRRSGDHLPPLPPPKDIVTPTRANTVHSRPQRPRALDSDLTLHVLAAADPSSALYQDTDWAPSPSTPGRPRARTIAKSSSVFTASSQTSPTSPRIRPSASLPIRAPRSKSLPRITPEERAERRKEEQSRLETEAYQAIRVEEERQARIKAEKSATLRQQQLEDHHRRMHLEDELRAAAFQKDMRERQEREEVERAKELLREKRRLQKERLAEENAWLEMCRREEAAKEEDIRLKREAERLELENERRSRIQTASDFIGWMNVQQEGSMHWKRRWCQLRGKSMSLFNAPPGELDLGKPVDILTIDKMARVREGSAAPEELEFVKNSFSLDVVGGRGTLLIYTHTAEEKEKLLACLRARTDL